MSGAPIDGGARNRALPWRQKIPGLGKALCAVGASAFAGGGRQQNPLYRPPCKGDGGRWLPRRTSFPPAASGVILHDDEAAKLPAIPPAVNARAAISWQLSTCRTMSACLRCRSPSRPAISSGQRRSRCCLLKRLKRRWPSRGPVEQTRRKTQFTCSRLLCAIGDRPFMITRCAPQRRPAISPRRSRWMLARACDWRGINPSLSRRGPRSSAGLLAVYGRHNTMACQRSSQEVTTKASDSRSALGASRQSDELQSDKLRLGVRLQHPASAAIVLDRHDERRPHG